MMRLVFSLLLALATVGCAMPGQVAAKRQACVECALREHPNPGTLPHAQTKFSRWCREGDARSCSVLGVMYENGSGVERDHAKAAQLYGRACRQGNARACVSLGRMMHDGTAARPDPMGAATMYESACLSGELEGCYELGRILRAAGEPRRAAKVMGQACEADHAPACETLGVMAAEGRGIKRNAARAQRLFRRACRGGQAKACTRL
jgi:TPR repeat protein